VLARAYALPAGSRRVYGVYPRRLKDLLWRYGPVWWGVLCRDQPLVASVHRKARVAAWVDTAQQRRQSAATAEGAPQIADCPGSTPDGTPSPLCRLSLVDLDPPPLSRGG